MTRRGQALIPVLLVVLALTALAVAIGTNVHSSLETAGNYTRDTERYYAAQGAANYALAALNQTSNGGATYGIVPPDQQADSSGWWKEGDCWVKVEVESTGSMIDLNTVSAATLQVMPVFQDNPTLAQAIVDWRTPQSSTGGTSGSGAGGAAAGAGGASGANNGGTSAASESQYYNGLMAPYSLKGAPYDTVQELLLVQGMTTSILYGTPAGAPAQPTQYQSTGGMNGMPGTNNGIGAMTRQARPGGPAGGPSRPGGGGGPARPGGAQGGGAPAGGAAGGAAGGGAAGQGGASNATAQANAAQFASIYQASVLPLSELFTPVARERNIAADGTARVNINTATAQDLEQAGFTAAQANAVVTYRNQQSSSNSGGASAGAQSGGAPAGGSGARPGSTPAAGGGGGARPGGSSGGGGTAGGGASGSGSGNSPAFSNIGDLMKVSGFTPQVMAGVVDKIAVNNNPYRNDVVDINTAPAEVLATVPGMDMTLLNAILQYRSTGQAFQTLADLFTLPGITAAELQNTVGHLTAKCSTYRIRVLVRMRGSQQVYAVQALGELTPNGPQILSWHHVQRAPGWWQWAPPPVLPMPTASTNSSSSSPSSNTGGL